MSDFDLGLFLSGANIFVASSEEEQGGGEPPFEELCVEQYSGYDLKVFWAIRGYSVSTSPQLDLVSWSPPLEYQVAAGSIAAPASSPAALAVGALCWQSRQLEPYSSQGPTIDGRMKPDIVGHDSVSGMTYGPFSYCPSAFAGTSASSPEVAGAAALVKQAYPAFGPDQVKQYLMRNARDLGAPGLDNVHGAGELQLPKPPDVVAPTATALVSTGSQGQGSQAARDRVGRLRRGQRDRARQARQQDGRDDQGEGLRLGLEPEDDRGGLEGSCECQGRLPTLRPRDRPGRQLEPGELREGRPQIAGGGR